MPAGSREKLAANIVKKHITAHMHVHSSGGNTSTRKRLPSKTPWYITRSSLFITQIISCFGCGSRGHYAAECPNASGNSRYNSQQDHAVYTEKSLYPPTGISFTRLKEPERRIKRPASHDSGGSKPRKDNTRKRPVHSPTRTHIRYDDLISSTSSTYSASSRFDRNRRPAKASKRH